MLDSRNIRLTDRSRVEEIYFAGLLMSERLVTRSLTLPVLTSFGPVAEVCVNDCWNVDCSGRIEREVRTALYYSINSILGMTSFGPDADEASAFPALTGLMHRLWASSALTSSRGRRIFIVVSKF